MIKKKAFTKNKLTNLILPDSLTTIEDRAFHGNKIKKVTIPDSVKEIGIHAFYMNKVYLDEEIKTLIIGDDDSEAQRYANSDGEKNVGITFELKENEDDTEKDTSISLILTNKDLNFTTILNKNKNIQFGKDLEGKFTVQYTVGEFIHSDNKNSLNPVNKDEFYKNRTAETFDLSTSKVFNNNIIGLNFLVFDNSEFVKKELTLLPLPLRQN